MSDAGLLSGRYAVVTDAGTPLGRAVVGKFAEQGAIVAFGAPDEASGARLLSEISRASPESFYQVMRLSDAASVENFCARVNAKFPVVRVLVNNPYSPVRKSLLDSDDADDAELLQIYQHSLVQTQRAFIGKMLEEGHCSIVNISSGAVFQGATGDLRRSTANAAIGGMTRVPVIEGGKTNVRANELLVSRSVNEPEMAPAPLAAGIRRPDVECAVEAALFLASDMSSYVNGVALNVDGGARLSL